MPPIDNQDELNIGLGMTGFDNIEETLARLEILLERARKNINSIFTGPVKDAEKLSEHVTSLERRVVGLTSSYAGIGKAGAKGFEQLNKIQLDAFEKLTLVQKKLQSIDATLGKDVQPSTLVRRKKEAIELEAELDRLEKKLLGTKPLDIIQKKFASDSPKPIVEKPDYAMQRANLDIRRMQGQRAQWERDLTKSVDTEAEKQYRIRVSTFQRGLNALLKGYRTIQQQEAKTTEKQSGGRGVLEQGFSKLGLGGLAGGLGPVAAIVAVGFAIQRAYGIAEQAIQRASEQARANRTLASSAAEAGINIDFLTKKNKEFAALTGISEVKATTTVAKITQLATLAQTPERIEKLIKGFANLGAARGLDPTGIETVVQQIITGQDEGYKKLLLPNPAQLQAKYARENNRTVGSLSAVEKAQIFQNEFLKKAELFNGAAEARLASVDGRAAKLNASFENLANTLSTKFANNYDVANFIEGLTKQFNSLNAEVDDLAGKAQRGINIDNLIKEQAKPGILGYGAAGYNTVMSGLITAASTVMLTAGSIVGVSDRTLAGFSRQTSVESQKYAESALANVNPDLREDFIRQQVNAQRKVDADNAHTEQQRQVEISRNKAAEEQQRFKGEEEKRLTDVFKDPFSNAKDILEGLSKVSQYGSDKFPIQLDTAKVQEETTKRFTARDPSLDVGKSPDVVRGEIEKQVTAEMQAFVDQKNIPLFDADALHKFTVEGSKALEVLAKKAHELVKDVREELVGALAEKEDNPFVKLLDDAAHAAEKAREKFARLGPELAEAMGKIAEQTALQKIAVADFEVSDKALRFRQQARRLDELPLTQTADFERRLQRVETEGQYQLTRSDLTRQTVESTFYGSTQASGKARKLREAFLRSQYGDQYSDLIAGARGTREEKDAYREVGVKIKEAKQDITQFRGVDTQKLGVYGEGALASQLLGRLPTVEELLPRLRGFGRGREEAQDILKTRADLTVKIREADDLKFKDFVKNQEYGKLNIKDAEEQAKNLFDRGGALPEKQKLDKFLAITDELGQKELTPELRQQRIKALGARADLEETSKKTAEEQMKTISSFIDDLKKQVENGGLIVKLGEVPIVEVNVNATGVSAELQARPSQQRSK